MLLNYLDYSKFLVILVIMLMALIVCIISYFKFSSTSEKLPLKPSENSPSPHISIKIKENNHNLKLKRESKRVKIQGFQQNEISEAQKKFNLGEITDNVDHLTQKLTNKKNNILEKKDEIANISIDSEDEEELLSSYKLGICRTFEKDENNIKTNIVKEVHGNLFKIYSEGNPNLIKEKCKKETIPCNFDYILQNYKEKGYNIIGLAGKKMKMNYLQSQRIDRSICESNMIFLGFVVYKVDYEGYSFEYS